jgi:hypothetical protein
MGTRGREFHPVRRQIIFARTKRPIGGGSRPPEGTPRATMLVYATLCAGSVSLPFLSRFLAVPRPFLSRSLAVSGVFVPKTLGYIQLYVK